MVITVSNQKGGVGKTTLAYHLSFLFARGGKKTLLIDTDPQGNLTSCFVENIPSENNLTNLYARQILKPIQIETNLELIGADITLSKFEADTKLENFFLLKNFISELKADIVLIDTPPSLGLFTSTALLSANKILIPMDISKFSVLGLTDLMNSIQKIIKTTNSSLEILGIIFTGIDDRLNLYKEVKENIKNKYPKYFLDVYIPSSVKVKESILQKKPIFDLIDEHKISLAYKNLYEEILRRL
ncbi:MAG: ParA family protein [Candidatus Omnitrophica bacterium]|jgi:chromosome partitioning protein|nr:ParA family protein [Candidatus Omnitrophota bacterium]